MKPQFSLLLGVVLLLGGCGTDVTPNASVPGNLAGGQVMGGEQPVAGATIQLFAASATGYGNASTSLATTMTDSNGNFLFTTSYTCPTPTTPVYITATQGNPGLTPAINNAQLALMVVLGPCQGLSSSTRVVINELTTVAAVWALAQFMTDFDHVGTSFGNATGLTNAFSMANVLANTQGQLPGATPPGGLEPGSELNTLADLLAYCVNSGGGVATDTSTPCGKLFNVVTPGGGTAPTNTVQAALDIALHPGNNGSVSGSTSALYQLTTSTGPFQPTLSAAPNDWTVAVNFPTGGTMLKGIAIDSAGDAFLVDTTSMHELSPTGANLGNYTSMAGYSVALDATNNVWVGGSGKVYRMPAALTAPAAYAYGLLTSGSDSVVSLAVDGYGSAWYTCAYCGTMGKLSSSGTFSGPFATTSDFHSNGVAVDGSENAWKVDLAGDVAVVNNSGSAVGSSPYTCSSCGDPLSTAIDASGVAWIASAYDLIRMTAAGSHTQISTSGAPGGMYAAEGVAIDGASNVWVANNANESNSYQGALSEFTNAGVAVTPTLGYVSSTLGGPTALAIDGSGNVWMMNVQTTSGPVYSPVYTPDPTVTVFIGAAVPVVTPLALGVKNNTLGTKP